MMGRLSVVIAAVLAVALLQACGREPNSLFDTAGYHVRGETVYYLNAFPGKAFAVEGADASSFRVLDAGYARDSAQVWFDGRPVDGADAPSFDVLQRPGFAKDRGHVYRGGQPVSDDPMHFELLGGELTKDGAAVYWSDGRVLSDDPAHFVIISDTDHYLFTSDRKVVHVNGNPIAGADPSTFRVIKGGYAEDGSQVFYFTDRIAGAQRASFEVLTGPYAADAHRVYWMGKAVGDADPATFRVLNAAFECSADDSRAYYRDIVIDGVAPASFPPDRAVVGCSATSVAFAD
jgi:hypothetical protein